MMTLNRGEFADSVKAKRGSRSLVVAGREAGVPAPTMGRVERQEGEPTLATFLALCHWLDQPPAKYLESEHTPGAAERSTKSHPESHPAIQSKSTSGDGRSSRDVPLLPQLSDQMFESLWDWLMDEYDPLGILDDTKVLSDALLDEAKSRGLPVRPDEGGDS